MEHYPADAARVVETSSDAEQTLRELSDAGATHLLDYVDPARLKPLFLSLDKDRQASVLLQSRIRTAMLILRSLSESER